MSLITCCNFTFIWVSAFCICWTWWEAYSTSIDPLPQVTAQASDLPVGTEGPRQQAVGVQLLQPLAVQHVGLAARARS